MSQKLDRLPKWARERIERAERDIEQLRAEARVGPDDSDTFVNKYDGTGTPAGRPLGAGPEIRFELGDDYYVLARIEGPGALRITAHGRRLHSGMAFLPRSSNDGVIAVGGSRAGY